MILGSHAVCLLQLAANVRKHFAGNSRHPGCLDTQAQLDDGTQPLLFRGLAWRRRKPHNSQSWWPRFPRLTFVAFEIEVQLPKAVRKDFFQWPANDMENAMSRLLENMRFTEIRIQGATQQASAVAADRIDMGQYIVDLRLQLSAKWTVQSDGVTVIFTIEEHQYEWSACLCNRLADSVIGAMKTIWELVHGPDT
jgi:hypothetical protein